MMGADGACVSMATVKVFDGELVVPTVVSVATKLYVPSLSVGVWKLQAPFASAVVVPRSVVPL